MRSTRRMFIFFCFVLGFVLLQNHTHRRMLRSFKDETYMFHHGPSHDTLTSFEHFEELRALLNLSSAGSISITDEHTDSLLEVSRRYVPPPSNETAAICLKTIFGRDRPDIMNVILKWLAYNRLLGFDEILVWYHKDFIPPGFERLFSLPYIKLVENGRNPILRNPDDYDIDNNSNFGGQNGDIVECLKLTKGKYDWVLIADWDEFLWFPEKMRLKEFLKLHSNHTWLSFGKWMYEYKVRLSVEEKDDPFDLVTRPFTFKTYCYLTRGEKVCPNWVGRSKVLFRRDVYDSINVHGGRMPDEAKGIIHFNTDDAHIKEWRGHFTDENETLREPTSYTVPADNHEMYEIIDGNYTVHFDPGLRDWFEFISDV